MTKKQSEKNKAWEKDRRDRLNKAFDELANLLPKYDPSVVWSKIEIIQKSIAFIAETKKQLDDYLQSKDPERFREHEEYVDCIRFYQTRNRQLTQLLKESNITVPPVVLPKLLLKKPELLPPPSNEDTKCSEKPKRQRGQAQKPGSKGKSTKGKTESTSDTEKLLPETAKDPPEKGCEYLSKTVFQDQSEAIVKPTAIITAITRETIDNEIALPVTPVPAAETNLQTPAKPFLLRLWKPKPKRKVRKGLFRQCYPHPSTTLDFKTNQKALRKLRKLVKRKRTRRKQPAKRIKLSEINPQPERDQSVSPTAAFLLSFPVVTPSLLSGKHVENVEASVSLENLNNFFATEEYSKFCDQNPVAEVKVPTPICTPIPVETPEKSTVSDKPMTSFTVSAITRPFSPKKTDDTGTSSKSAMQHVPMILDNKIMDSPAVSFDKCFDPLSTAIFTKSDLVTSFPRFIQSTIKNSGEPNAGISQNQQKALPPVTDNCARKSKVSPKGTDGVLSMAHIPVSSKTASKPAVSPFYSPTKAFPYDFTPQSQPTLNFNVQSSLTLSTEFLNSITSPSKTHSLLPSIKPGHPWLPANTTTTPAASASTTNTTSIAPCNLNANFTPFDTNATEAITTINFSYPLTPTKNSDPILAESSKKSSATTKCNTQMNLFLPYEDGRYTPNFSTVPKLSDTPWKSEKVKDTTDQIFYDCEQSKQKSHVNWMTQSATDFTPTPAALPLPPIEFGNNQLQPASSNFDFTFGCRKDTYDEDNQFMTWSPTKPINTDFTTPYSYENFGSNEAPPNKTIKQIFSVSQLVDQSSVETPMKKTVPKMATQKSNNVKQTFSNIYSAESLIAKKDHSHRFYNNDAPNIQADFHNTSNYFYNYSNAQTCPQSENDYLGANAYSTAAASSTIKTTSVPPFDSITTAPSTTNYFTHSISSNANDPYDPTYFPSTNYNHPTNWSHGHSTMKANNYNQGYGGVDAAACQQSTNVSGNLTNFNLSSICPEIHGKAAPGPSGW